MADPTTSRIPRETLAGLIASASDGALDRITAPMPVAQLDALLDEPPQAQPEAHGSSPDLVVRFKPARRDLSSRQVMLLSFAVWILLGLLVFVIA